jgi:hypothetical protein
MAAGRVTSLVESVGQCLPLLDWQQFVPDGLFNKLFYINLLVILNIKVHLIK